MDEQPPQIEPNIADDEKFCADVIKFIQQEYFYPYYIMQQRLHESWRFADDMWRARIKASDLDEEFVREKPAGAQGKGKGKVDPKDGQSAKLSPAAGHRQMDSLLSLYCSISLKDGGTPIRFIKPEAVFEHPLYNPTQQAADAANLVYKQNCEEVDLQTNYRQSAGSFVRYNIAWALADLEREMEDVVDRYTLSGPPEQQMMQQALLMNQRGQPESVTPTVDGRTQIGFKRRVIKNFRTNFQPLDPDQVFVDLTIKCRPIENQPCPMIRTHMTDVRLESNEYDPQLRPFGWLNTELAMDNTRSHYAMSQADETAYARRCADKYGITDTLQYHPEQRIKQLWTAYPMLRCDPQRKLLDTGEGVDCPTCNGKRRVPAQDETGQPAEQECQTCGATGKVRLRAQRYVVQIYGSMFSNGQSTCLRIQRNPTAKDKVPLIFASLMVEDTAGAIPTSKAEISKGAYVQLATSTNQFVESKNKTINRPFKKKIDSPSWTVDCNEPNASIPFDMDPKEVERIAGNTYDETVTLLPFMDRMDSEITSIFGVTPSQMGMISEGRRAASEMVNVFEAGKIPIVVQIDSFNHQMMGGHAMLMIDNLEIYGDRDWIKDHTGRTTFGRLGLFTATAEEFFQRMALIQNAQYLLQASVNDPAMANVRPDLWGEIMEAMGMRVNRSKLDGGLRKSQQDAFTVVAKILGDGQLTPPDPSDPDQAYIDIFNEALKDDYWKQKAPQNMQLLFQRIQMQTQQMLNKNLDTMQAAMINRQDAIDQREQEQAAKGNGNQPKRPSSPPSTAGEAVQHAQG